MRLESAPHSAQQWLIFTTKSAGHITQISVPRAPAAQLETAIDASICPWLYMLKLHDGKGGLAHFLSDAFNQCKQKNPRTAQGTGCVPFFVTVNPSNFKS